MAEVEVCAFADLPTDKGKTFSINEFSLAFFRVGDAVYAIDDTCSHAEASLGEGDFDADDLCVECPLHGSRFDIRSGKALTLPAFQPVKTYPVRLHEGRVFVELNS